MFRLTAVVLTLFAFAGVAIGQPAPSASSEKEKILNAELFIAIRSHDSAAVEKVISSGADVHMRNWLNFTPLMWAACQGDQKIVDILLKRGVGLEDNSIYGTALAEAENCLHEKLALHLISKGAKTTTVRVDGLTLLMMAANNGHTDLMDAILKTTKNVNAVDQDGASALTFASRMGHTAAVRRLLDMEAKIDLADSHGKTALMYAAQNGNSETVNLLISKHADVNVKDRQGAAALQLAARYSGDPAVIKSLMLAGANASLQDGKGKTAFELAESRGYVEAAKILQSSEQPEVKHVSSRELRTIKQSVQDGVTVLQSGLKGFSDRTPCTSCHHQGLGLTALGQAAQRGYIVDPAVLGTSLKRMGEEGKAGGSLIHRSLTDKRLAKTIQAVDIGDFSVGAGYIFSGMIACGVPANPGLGEAAQFLASQQENDGHWEYGMDRVPMQSSAITTTALVLQMLKAYGDSNSLAPNIEKAKKWLISVPVHNSEEKAARVLGLYWSGASKQQIQPFAQELMSAQLADGGWAELENLHSNAFATGLALYSLRLAGAAASDDPGYQRGIQFLRRTQDEDGSWYVNKRAIPDNVYFDAGFPHGESQYISYAATCWATMALMQSAESANTASR